MQVASYLTMPVHMYCRWRLCCFTEIIKKINKGSSKKKISCIQENTFWADEIKLIIFYKKGKKRTENVIRNLTGSIFLTWKRLIYFKVFAKLYPRTIYEEMKKIPVWSKVKNILKFEFKQSIKTNRKVCLFALVLLPNCWRDPDLNWHGMDLTQD